MATATEVSPTFDPTEGRIVFPGVDWGGYEKMLQVVGDRRVHVTYDEGTMEVRMPSQRHEQSAQLFGFFVLQVADEMGIDFEPQGMTTWKRPDMEKGLEADQCYYIRNAVIVRERVELDLEVDPPPDLAIEVDITSSSLDRMGIYAELRVPEVWRHDGRKSDDVSTALRRDVPDLRGEPELPRVLRPADVERFIELGRTTPKRQWAREIRSWVRDVLIPRRNAPGIRDEVGPAPG